MQLIIGGILLGILAWVGFTIAPFIFSFLGNLLALAGIAIVGLFAGFIGLIEAGIENWDRVLISIGSFIGLLLVSWFVFLRITVLKGKKRTIIITILYSILFGLFPAIFVIFLLNLILDSWLDIYDPFFISVSIFLVYWSLVTYYQCKNSLNNKIQKTNLPKNDISMNETLSGNIKYSLNNVDNSIFIFHIFGIIFGMVSMLVFGGAITLAANYLDFNLWKETRIAIVLISFFIPFYILYKQRDKN